MEYSENLNLKLPDDNDPLKVSDLSENFSALDEAIGDQSSAEALAKSMKVGDITYSTRNLEEESGGVLMACDQRTIDIDAYPDIPRNALFWPLPELIFSHAKAESREVGATAYAYNGINRDANTNKFIYLNGIYYSGTAQYKGVIAYSIDEGKIYYTGNPGEDAPFVRIAENKIVLLNGNANIYSNVLATTGSQLSAGAARVIYTPNGQITRLGPSSFFIVSFLGTGETYPAGFYKTSDGFSTIQPITSASQITDVSSATFDQLDRALASGALYKSPFFPIQKKANGEIVACFKGGSTSADYSSSSEIGTRQNIRNMLPTIWETSGGISTIASKKLGGQELEGWVFNKMVEHGATNGATINIYAPLNGEYYFFKIIFTKRVSSSYYYYPYAVIVNIETGAFYASSVSETLMNPTSGIGIKTFYYDKHKKKLINIRSGGITFDVVDIGTQTIEDSVYSVGGFNMLPADPINYMDSAVAIRTTGTQSTSSPLDKRYFDLGYPVHLYCPLILFDKDVGGFSGFMGMNTLGTNVRILSANTQNPAVSIVHEDGFGGSCAANMVEVDGDIYVEVMNSLYKLPKNKRQMPYIKNGYMKVLNETVEGGAE